MRQLNCRKKKLKFDKKTQLLEILAASSFILYKSEIISENTVVKMLPVSSHFMRKRCCHKAQIMRANSDTNKCSFLMKKLSCHKAQV